METKTKQYVIVTVIGVTLFAALLNFSAVLAFAGKVINLILPVIVGGMRSQKILCNRQSMTV